MKVILNIIKYILVIILSISIILTIAIHTITSTILDKNYILGKLEETNYYNNIYNQVESNFENYIYQSGLDEEVLNEIITEEEIKEDTIQIVNNIYDNENSKAIDVTKIKDRLEKNIYDSISTQKVSDSTKKSIDQFVNKIIEEYKDTIVHTNYETNINETISKLVNYAQKAEKVLVIINTILVILILLLNAKQIFRGFAQIGIALTATGIFNSILNIIINSKVKIDNITVLNNGFSFSLRNILHDVLNTFLTNGFILLAVGLILIVISNLIINKKTNSEKLN